jgi:hypothetical protein
MEKYKKYKEAFPNKTDAQCIESLCWEVSDKVETIHKLLEDMADKKYTEEDIIKAIAYGQTTKQIDYHKDFINSLNKQD